MTTLRTAAMALLTKEKNVIVATHLLRSVITFISINHTPIVDAKICDIQRDHKKEPTILYT